MRCAICRHASLVWLVAASIGGALLLGTSHAGAQDDWPRLSPGPTPAPEPASAPGSAPPASSDEAPVVAPSAPEPLAPRFGSPGEVLLTSGLEIGFRWTSFDESPATFRSAVFSPGIDVFVVRDLSVGLDVDLRVSENTGYAADGSLNETKFTSVGAGPRVGFNVRLGPLLSFYPRLTFGYRSIHRNDHAAEDRPGPVQPPDTSSTSGAAWLALFTPLLFHPAPHFFLGLGPSFYREVGKTGATAIGEGTTVAAQTVIGVWWGGPKVGPPPDDVEPAPRGRRFGDARMLVLTGAVGAAVQATAYDHSSASSVGASLAPGLDYFFADHVSLGIAAGIAYAKVQTPAAGGRTLDDRQLSLYITPRFGVDLPITSALSLYPRASMAIGVDDVERESPLGVANDRTDVVVTFGVFAPLLVHFASHAFVGIGPSAAHDVVRKNTNGGRRDTLGTTFGASALVGAWL